MGTDNWSTPDPIFQKLHEEFNFNLDVCASDWNHKCENYFTEKDDALTKDWEGVFWMNPPYSCVGKWVEYAYYQVEKGNMGVCLIPSRTETKYFHNFCLPHELRFVQGRIHFFNDEETSGRPRFGNVIVIMRPTVIADRVPGSFIQPIGLKIN